MDIVKNIGIIFISIFFESLPFLLLGALLSSIIETYVSDETISKFIPKNKITDNKWYEIEGVLEKGKDKEGYDIMYINVINIKEIDFKNEEQYIYHCYAYEEGSCEAIGKYNLEY